MRCALALLAFGLAAPAAAQFVELPLMSRRTPEGRAAREAAFERDRVTLRVFLAALRAEAPAPERYISYYWLSPAQGRQAIDQARFAALVAPCVSRSEGMELVLTSHTPHRGGPSSEQYIGIAVDWACRGRAAATPELHGSFRFDGGAIAEVVLSPEPATATR